MFRLLALAIPLAAFVFAAPSVRADDHDHHDSHFMECAKACDACARICEACATHCAELVAKGETKHLETLKTCRDCATFCEASSSIMARKGPFADLICKACADACKRCGDACEQFKDDPMMKECAEECRKCEKSCREMLKHLGHVEKN